MVCHTATNRLRTTVITDVKTESLTAKTFIFKDKECARAKPGQFLMLWIPSVDEIPLSILDAGEDGKVSVVVKVVGEATNALHGKKVGETIGVRGPFGNNFSVNGRRLLFVGGGTGVAPLLFATKRMERKTAISTFVSGAKTEDELLFKNELERMVTRRTRVILSTEDGSCGTTGLCTEPLEQVLTREKFDAIYACGPEKMILKVFELAERYGIELQASLERLMKCAIGLCGSCTIGKYRVCADGPVFTSKQLREVKSELGVSRRDRDGRKIPLE